MPSADSRYAVGSPYGSLTHGFCILPRPFVCFPDPLDRARQGHGSAICLTPGFCFTGFSLVFRYVSVAGPSRGATGLPG